MTKTLVGALAVAALLGLALSTALAADDPAAAVIALERQALDGLGRGNLDALLALSDTEISYFHVMTTARLDGATAVQALVEPYRGRPLFDRYEMLTPRVQVAGDVAVLTYVLEQRNGAASTRWNGTQVYRRHGNTWRIIHTHWSQTGGGPTPR